VEEPLEGSLGEAEAAEESLAPKPKAKFQNENAVAGSNLRQKDKKFSFGGLAGMSDSEEEEKEEPAVDFSDSREGAQGPEKEDSDEEMQLHLMRTRGNEKKNPFASRIGN
jgi:hypothetical protein